MAGGKIKTVKYWALKIFIISLILSAGISLISELFLYNLSLTAALIVLFVLIAVGVVFDIIGVAFASCDQTPFISMASKKIKKAYVALKMLKNADIVSSICNDVVGDICGIVSGAAGASIAAMICVRATHTSDFVIGIAVASITAALTVSGKALGKKIAIKKNRQIVESIGALCSVFSRRKQKGR